MSEYNPPSTLQIYLGSGEVGKRLRENIKKYAKGESVSKMILRILKRAEPALFKGVDHGPK